MMANGWNRTEDWSWRRGVGTVRLMSGGDWVAFPDGKDAKGFDDRRQAEDWLLVQQECEQPHAATMAEGLKLAEGMERNDAIIPVVQSAYASLSDVLNAAYRQAATGKGKDRHTDGGSVPFDQQPIMTITRSRGVGFALGQVDKKTDEAQRMASRGEHAAAEAELLGAIVYAAAAVLRLRELAEGDDFEDIKIGGTG